METVERFIILFDEAGTPTFKEESETDIFAGIAILYPYLREEEIFDTFKETLGFSRKAPLKAQNISERRAQEIANLACDKLPMIVFNYVELRNNAFAKTILDYESLVSFGRKIVRGAKPRKVSQILHSRLLDNCVHKCILNHLEHETQGNFQYDISIDNWSIPKDDQSIELDHRATSFKKATQLLLNKCHKNINISIPEIKLLKKDGSRKRLIDAMASITSRAFFARNHPRFSEKPFRILEGYLGRSFECNNITNDEILFIKQMIQKFANEHF
ncbi:hypothetical protein L0337_35115 [candidate division KSB1 bacterium]|nr:hypothetical protein [candidate division KSB1 bacterium]